jgi:hypothetical protein
MSDIVERLERGVFDAETGTYVSYSLCDEAADTITTLRAEVAMWKEAALKDLGKANDEIERLRAALEYYAGRHNYIGRIDQLDGKAYPSAVIVDNGNMARAALAQEKQDG